MNNSNGFEDGGFCMIFSASANFLAGAVIQEVFNRCSKQICAFCVYAPMAPRGSGSQMSGETIFQEKKNGRLKAYD